MKNTQIEQIQDFINNEIEKAGYKLVDLIIKGGRKLNLELILDKDGGITLDECASFNKSIVTWIESNNVNAGNFTVDVCSPGLDRELKSESSFIWAKGKEVQVTTRELFDGKNVITGTLSGISGNGDIDILFEDGKKITIKKSLVNRVKLHPKI